MNKRRIVLVDDDADLRKTLVDQLSHYREFELIEGATGADALAKVRDGHVDLMLLDVGLPDMDGREAVKILRREGFKSPILMLTAQDSDADDRLYRLGASMLDALTAGAPPEPLARYFEYWLLRLQGVYPEVRGTLSPQALGFLASARAVPPHEVGAVPADVRVLRELEGVHRALIATHLEKSLKSDRVLREMRRAAEN